MPSPVNSPAEPRRVLPLHPIFLAAFPLLALYAANIGRFPADQVLRPLGLSLLAAVVLWAVFSVFTRHTRKAALAASAVILVFFSYGHLYNVLPPTAKWVAGPFCAGALLGLLVLVMRSRHPLIDATRVLNLASIVLIAPSCWAIADSLWGERHIAAAAAGVAGPMRVGRYLEPDPPGTALTLPAARGDRPDIYYIVLDAYGREDRLKTFYGYDNAPFIKALEERGFYVASHSRSNYDQTTLCMSSALNMDYLRVPDDLQRLPEAIRAPLPLRRMIDENRVAAFLRKLGYRYVNVWAGLEETRVRSADLVLNGETKRTSFENESLGLTALEAAPTEQRDRYDRHRERIVEAFENLENVARMPYTKFVFAHILAPHPPFVLGPNGEAVYPKGPLSLADASWLLKDITRDEYRKGYIAQLQYVNLRVLEAIDTILKRSHRPPVIIVQGDHGSRMSLDWESEEKTDLREPFSILNAYHVPPQVRPGLYDGITPVNSFRVVLSKLYGASLPLIPDRSFYSTASRPTAFTEVTQQLSRLH